MAQGQDSHQDQPGNSGPDNKRTRMKSKAPVKIRRPRPGSKAEAILTLTTTTPATQTEIAESVNTSPQHVNQTLKRFGIEPNAVESFKQHRADILAGMQEKLLNSIEMVEIKSARDQKDSITGFGILYDKERLERGQATSFEAHIDLTGKLQEALKRAGSGSKVSSSG